MHSPDDRVNAPPHHGPEDPTVEHWEPSGVITTMWLSLSIALGGLSLFFFGLIYTLVGSQSAASSLDMNWPVVAGITAFILALHPLLHAGVAKMQGGRPRIDLDVVQWILPVMYCRVEGEHFSRVGYLAYSLTPLLAPSIIGAGLMVIDARAVWLIIPLAVNAAVSIRDVWTGWIVWRLPSDSLVRGERNGLMLIRPSRSTKN